jgi:hypothetical protein
MPISVTHGFLFNGKDKHSGISVRMLLSSIAQHRDPLADHVAMTFSVHDYLRSSRSKVTLYFRMNCWLSDRGRMRSA